MENRFLTNVKLQNKQAQYKATYAVCLYSASFSTYSKGTHSDYEPFRVKCLAQGYKGPVYSHIGFKCSDVKNITEMKSSSTETLVGFHVNI